jgi:phage/plasmid-like protein (TIGR03299 family)
MPANIESMFSVRQMPWHREGTVLPDYPGSWAQARVLAGLDWDPVRTPLYELAGEPGSRAYRVVKGWEAVTRSDSHAMLTIARDSYALIDHGEMGEIIEAVLGQPSVKWETAGSLDGGKAVWCLAKLDEPFTLPGDTSAHVPYLAITNRHDGTAACALRATAIRIVCANTFAAAELEGERSGATFSFVHRSGWRDRIGEAREAVTGARQAVQDYRELAESLLGVPVTSEQRELFVRMFIPEPPATMITDRVARNIEEARQAVRGILASVTCEGTEGTAYGLVQAAGEYLDHVRRARSWETRLGRTLIRPEPLKHRAMALALEVAKS